MKLHRVTADLLNLFFSMVNLFCQTRLVDACSAMAAMMSPVCCNSKRRRFSEIFVFTGIFRISNSEITTQKCPRRTPRNFEIRKTLGENAAKRDFWNSVVFWNRDKQGITERSGR